MKKLLLMMLIAVMLTGCQGNNKKKLYGYWRSDAKSPFGTGYKTFMLTKDEISIDDREPVKIKYVYKDGLILIRVAGTENIMFSVDFIDKNTINTSQWFNNGKYVRSNKAEMEQLRAEKSKPRKYPPLKAGYGTKD